MKSILVLSVPALVLQAQVPPPPPIPHAQVLDVKVAGPSASIHVITDEAIPLTEARIYQGERLLGRVLNIAPPETP
jgi:hypothetical protein